MNRKESPHPGLRAPVLFSLALLVAAGPAVADMRMEAPAPDLPRIEAERTVKPVPARDFSHVLRRSLERRGMMAPRTPAPRTAPATLPVMRPRPIAPQPTRAPSAVSPQRSSARE